MKFNPEQEQASATREGAWVVEATAGAGKTTTLCDRVRGLFREGATQDEVLVLTFTREAAENLVKKLNLDPPKMQRGGFRTFHSFCLNLVRREARFLPYTLSANPFPDGPVISKMILAAMKRTGIRRKQFDEVKAFISRLKRQRISPEEAEQTEDSVFCLAYEHYENGLREAGLLDYDGMIVEAVNILEQSDEARARWQFKWVMVDEAQDTDDLQFRLLQLITEQHKNIFAVGDFCQALYEFRGASPRNLLEFASWFPGAKTIILPENFRSSSEIVEFSRKHAPIDNDLTRNIRTANPKGGLPVELKMYSGSTAEAESVLSAASSDPGNSAVLARTNDQLGAFESLAVLHGIKFNLLGKSGLWTKPEVKMLVGLAAFCMSPATQGTKYSELLVAPFKFHIRKLPPEQGLDQIIRHGKLDELFSNEDFAEDENFALTNLKTVVGLSKRFGSLGDFLNHARKAEHASRKTKNSVTFSTVHQAKGLEWKNVFLIGCEEGLLPHKKGEIEEERRIFYVAITRPQRRLVISFSGTPSRFLEADLTPEIQGELRKNILKVEKLQKQGELFGK